MEHQDDPARQDRRSDDRSPGTELFQTLVDRAVKDVLRLGSELPVSCPKPLLDIVEALTERMKLRASDVIDAVERLEAQREIVVISTAVGWSIRLATSDEASRNNATPGPTSESPWPLIREQLDAMRAIADDRYSLEFAEQRQAGNHAS